MRFSLCATSDLDTDDLYMEIPPWFEYLTSSPPPVSQDPRPGIGEPASAPMRELRRKLKIATSKAQIREGRFKGKALRLKKALYGLKQSSRCFNDKLSAYLATVDPAKPELGFTRSGTDYSIYYKRVPRAEPNERTGDGSPFADHDMDGNPIEDRLPTPPAPPPILPHDGFPPRPPFLVLSLWRFRF